MEKPTPLYVSDRVTIYCADALDVLPGIPNKTVDLLVTDPPYGVGYRSNQRSERFDRIAGDATEEEALTLARGVVGEAIRALRPHRHLYVFGPFTEALHPDLGSCAEVVWNKGAVGMGDLAQPWGPQHERILFGTRQVGTKPTGRLTARLRKGSVITVPRKTGTQVNRHPTEKPVALLTQLIESSSCVGETVLDPFLGCGSTAVAAVLAGRRAIGIELDPNYAAIAVERVREAEAIRDRIEAL